MVDPMADITVPTAPERAVNPLVVWAIAVAIPLMLVAPALWNGYPILQSDTGGYLARWYEGYLVPSRSTVFGLYLHYGEHTHFWVNLVFQALATMWILQLTLRVFGLAKPWRLFGVSLALTLTTALPWLASMLLTDIFAGLSVLSLFILVLHGDKISRSEKAALFVFTAFAAATHSATMAVLRFTWRLSRRRAARKLEALRRAVGASPDWRVVGEPVIAQYDGPGALPFLRRNEVMIEVRRRVA